MAHGGVGVRKPMVVAMVVAFTLSLMACGSTGKRAGGGVGSSTSSATTLSESSLTWNVAEVAVAQDHAVVADGNLPTRFSSADLSSDEPERLRPLEPPVAMVAYSVAAVGDRIVVLGNQCDRGVHDADPEIVCDPGTALVFTFAPSTGKWTKIPVGIAGASFGSATMLPGDGPTTTVDTWLNTKSAPNGEPVLFTLDVKAGTFTPQTLPSGYARPLQGGSGECVAASGAQTLMTSALMEDVSDSAPSHIWWRANSDDPWTVVDPPPADTFAWQYDRCVAGMLVVSVPDGKQRRRIMFEHTTRTWRDLPAHDEIEDDFTEGLVHEPAMNRRWINGRIWAFDPARLRYVATDEPTQRVDNVRWSVPWGSEKVVALVDDNFQVHGPDDEMDLRIEVVTVPRHSSPRRATPSTPG